VEFEGGDIEVGFAGADQDLFELQVAGGLAEFEAAHFGFELLL
jgi:hypothetical protein